MGNKKELREEQTNRGAPEIREGYDSGQEQKGERCEEDADCGGGEDEEEDAAAGGRAPKMLRHHHLFPFPCCAGLFIYVAAC